MELKLTFKEKEFRALYASDHEKQRKILDQRLEERRPALATLVILTIAAFGLTFAHRDWMYVGWFCFLLLGLFLIKSEWLKQKTRKIINESQEAVDQYIATIKDVEDVRYVYDDVEIRYLESFEVKDTFRWNDLHQFAIDETIIHLYFNNSPTILIPASMADEQDFKLFLETLNKKIEALRREAQTVPPAAATS